MLCMVKIGPCLGAKPLSSNINVSEFDDPKLWHTGH